MALQVGGIGQMAQKGCPFWGRSEMGIYQPSGNHREMRHAYNNESVRRGRARLRSAWLPPELTPILW